MSIEVRYKQHLASLSPSITGLLDFLQDEALRFKKQVGSAEVQELIDHVQVGDLSSSPKHSSKRLDSLEKGRSRDRRFATEMRIHVLRRKVRALEKRPGQELEPGWAYLERELLEDLLIEEMDKDNES